MLQKDFRSIAGILSWLSSLGILTLFTIALTWGAVLPGLIAKLMDGAIAFSYPLIFLPFISSVFNPTETMPGQQFSMWVHIFRIALNFQT